MKLQAMQAWEQADIAKENARKKERIAEDLSQRLLRVEADRKAREEPARKKEMEEQKKRVAAG